MSPAATQQTPTAHDRFKRTRIEGWVKAESEISHNAFARLEKLHCVISLGKNDTVICLIDND